MSSVPILEPSVSFDGRLASGVVLQAALNGFTTAHVSHHRDVAVQVGGSDEAVAAMAAAQARMFASPETASVKMNTGANSWTLEGYEVSPSYSIGPNAQGNSSVVIHQMAALGSLRLDIYNGAPIKDTRVDYSVGGNSLAARLYNVTKVMVDNYSKTRRGGNEGDFDTNTDKDIHAQNMRILPLWIKLLEASADSTQLAGLEGLEPDDTLSVQLNSWLITALRSSKGDFMATLLGIAGAFNCVLQPPGPQLPVGRLALVSYLLNDTKSLKVKILRQGQLALGSHKLLPYTAVQIVGMPSSAYNPQHNYRASSVPNTKRDGVVTWPPGAAGSGRVFSTSPPGFLLTNSTQIAEEFQSYGLGGDHFKQSIQAGVAAQQTRITKPAVKLCEEYAKGIYINLALAPASANFVVEGNLDLQGGQHYAVSGPDGKLFSGILSQLQTTIATTGPAAGEVNSTLTFSHVEASGFKLPGR